MIGGTEQQLLELISHLDRRCFEPYVVCLYSERADRGLHHLAALQSMNIPVHLLDLGWSAADKVYGVLGVARVLRQVQPHIVHAVNYHSNWLVRLVHLFLVRHMTIVSSVYIEYTAKQLLYERLFGWLDTAVVCNSVYLREQLCSVLPSRPTRIITNGIDLQRFSPLTERNQQRFAVFVGRITKQKAAHILVEALGILKQRGELPRGFRVAIIGESVDRGAQQLIDETIRLYKLSAIVQQLSPAEQPEIYFQAADFSVLPSVKEGLPNVVIESLACGCPVVISTAANQSGIIEQGITGWIVPTNNAYALAETLIRAINLPTEARAQMAIDCRRSASAYSMMDMVHHYEQLYESLDNCS